MAFLWSSSSVRAYRPPAKPSFPLSEISSINMRLHPAARREVTEVQHPGKSSVTIRDVPIDPTPGQNQSLNPSAARYVEDGLYDLKTDPYELHNLTGFGSHTGVADASRQKLVARMVESGEPRPIVGPP
jgi:hypothetical protein